MRAKKENRKKNIQTQKKLQRPLENEFLKKARKLLSEDYESVINSIQELIFIIDIAGRIVGFNDKFARSIKPCSRQEALGQDFRDVLKKYWGKGNLEESCRKSVEDILFQRDKNSLESSFLKSGIPTCSFVDGKFGQQEGLFKIRSFPSFDKNEVIRRVVCVVNDITNIRIADANLRKVTELNEKILKNIPVGIVTVNKEGFVTFVNDCARKFTSKNKIKTLIIESSFIKRNKLDNDFKELLEKGKHFNKFECIHKNKQNQEIFLNVRGVPLFDINDNIEGALIIVEDETSIIKTKRELYELNQVLEQKVLDRTKQLKEAINSKTRFLADASHELRTPLTIMRGNTDLLSRKEDIDDETKEMLEIVRSQIDHMVKMLLDLTMLARGDRDISGLEIKKFSVANTIENCLKIFRNVANKKGIELFFKNNSKKIKIIGDEEKIGRMISNLVSNAIKYGKQRGYVRIKLENKPKEIIISVSDNGTGIPEKELPQIFERFYRLDRSRNNAENEESAGLGLAICKWISEVHGGSIKVESRVNAGSTFKVHLPYKPVN